jgi:hypothetical protein
MIKLNELKSYNALCVISFETDICRENNAYFICMINVSDRIKVSQYNMPSVTKKEKIGIRERKKEIFQK